MANMTNYDEEDRDGAEIDYPEDPDSEDEPNRLEIWKAQCDSTAISWALTSRNRPKVAEWLNKLSEGILENGWGVTTRTERARCILKLGIMYRNKTPHDGDKLQPWERDILQCVISMHRQYIATHVDGKKATNLHKKFVELVVSYVEAFLDGGALI